LNGGVGWDTGGLEGVDVGSLGTNGDDVGPAVGLTLEVGVVLAAVWVVTQRLLIDLSPSAFAGPQPMGVVATSNTPITATVTTLITTPATS
jgi:hypothetical protein